MARRATKRATKKTTQNPRVEPDASPAPGAGQGGADDAPSEIHPEEKRGGGGDPAAARGRKGLTLVVVGPKKGRRRIGRHFGKEPTTIPLADLTAGERAALKADKALKIFEAGDAA